MPLFGRGKSDSTEGQHKLSSPNAEIGHRKFKTFCVNVIQWAGILICDALFHTGHDLNDSMNSCCVHEGHTKQDFHVWLGSISQDILFYLCKYQNKQMKTLKTNQDRLCSGVSWLGMLHRPQITIVEEQGIRHGQWLTL